MKDNLAENLQLKPNFWLTAKIMISQSTAASSVTKVVLQFLPP